MTVQTKKPRKRHVAEILGHSLQSITRRYAHLAKGSLRPVLDDLARIEEEGFRDHEKGEKTSNGDAEVTHPGNSHAS